MAAIARSWTGSHLASLFDDSVVSPARADGASPAESGAWPIATGADASRGRCLDTLSDAWLRVAELASAAEKRPAGLAPLGAWAHLLHQAREGVGDVVAVTAGWAIAERGHDCAALASVNAYAAYACAWIAALAADLLELAREDLDAWCCEASRANRIIEEGALHRVAAVAPALARAEDAVRAPSADATAARRCARALEEAEARLAWAEAAIRLWVRAQPRALATEPPATVIEEHLLSIFELEETEATEER